MGDEEKTAILDRGKYMLDVVRMNPDIYEAVLGSYLNNNTLFGRLIRFWERGRASHSSVIIIERVSRRPVLELHALEGYGMIATEPAVLAHIGARVEMRYVKNAPPVRWVLSEFNRVEGAKYEKPLGFVTKSRREDPMKWFCSEWANHIFKTQNCADCFVSPTWARRSPLATVILGYIRVTGDPGHEVDFVIDIHGSS